MFGWLKRKSAAKSAMLTREFNFTIAGVEYAPGGVTLVRQLRAGDEVLLVPEPDNPRDKKAIAVCNNKGQRMGYVPAHIAADVMRALVEDEGKLSAVRVIEKIAEGREHKKFNALLQFRLERLRRDRKGR